MLYRTLKRLLEKGHTDSMAQKLEAFYTAGRLCEAEYAQLLALLG